MRSPLTGTNRLGSPDEINSDYSPSGKAPLGARSLREGSERNCDAFWGDATRPIAGHLITALDTIKRKEPVEIPTRWVRGTPPTTLGVLSVILFALRKECEQSRPAINRFLADHFRPRFILHHHLDH